MVNFTWNDKKAIDTNSEAFKQKLIRLGMAIEGDAKRNCRDLGIVDTGRLRASISVNWTGSGKARGEIEAPRGAGGKGLKKRKAANPQKADDGIGQPTGGEFKVVVGTAVKYAPFHEFGTRYIMPRPYLRPAYAKNIAKFLKQLGKI